MEPESWAMTLIKGSLLGLAAGAGSAALSRMVDGSKYKTTQKAIQGSKTKIPIPKEIAIDNGMCNAIDTLQSISRRKVPTLRELISAIQDLAQLRIDVESMDPSMLSPRMVTAATKFRDLIRQILIEFIEDSKIPLVPDTSHYLYGQPLDEEIRNAVSTIVTGIDAYVTNIQVEIETKEEERLEASWLLGKV